MTTRGIVFAMSCGALAFACAEQQSETQEIIDNLVEAGFPADDITVVAGVVYVGADAEVSLTASREMLQASDSSQEQYRTTNTVMPILTKICIDGSTFTGVFSVALDRAIQNYDEQPLTFAMARTPSSGCSFTINAVLQPGVVGGSSGFPSNGFPFATINIGSGLSTYSIDTIEHVITHEIGHTIGLRHSDFFNRSISCGSGGDEGDAGIGAIHIPGTPTGATVGGSLMNSCFRASETGEFADSDVVALRALYAKKDEVPDILWRSHSGDNVIWPDANFPGYGIASADNGWRVVGIGDLDGDDKSDILWRSINGSNVIWSNGNAPGYPIAPVGNEWQFAGIGDFDENGKSDILWRNINGGNVIWPDANAPGYWIASVDNGWQVAGIGDFDGNGKSDILWRNINGGNVIWPDANPPGYWIASVDNGWQVAGIGDFDGNWKSDILWRSTNGDNVIWPDANAPGYSIAPVDNGWQVAGIGRFTQ